MKKFCIIIICFLAAQLNAKAQIGILVKAGISAPSVTFPKQFEEVSKLKFGFLGGAGLNLPLGRKFSIQPEVMFVQKGEKKEYDGDGFKITENITLNYVEIPVLVQYKLLGDNDNSGIKLFLQAGPYVGFGLGGKAKSEGNGSSMEYDIKFGEPDNRQSSTFFLDNSLDFGASFGAGLGLPIGPGSFLIDLRYNLGLTNLMDKQDTQTAQSSDNNSKNRYLAFSLGYLFRIGSK